MLKFTSAATHQVAGRGIIKTIGFGEDPPLRELRAALNEKQEIEIDGQCWLLQGVDFPIGNSDWGLLVKQVVKMNKETAKEILKNARTDYSQRNRLLLGMNLIASTCGPGDELDTSAEHDVICVGVLNVGFEQLAIQLGEEKLQQLGSLGFHYNRESDSLAFFT